MNRLFYTSKSTEQTGSQCVLILSEIRSEAAADALVIDFLK